MQAEFVDLDTLIEDDCTFCKISSNEINIPFESIVSKILVTEEILFKTNSFYIVADIAPIMEGQYLIILNNHFPSMSFLNDATFNELINLKQKLRDLLHPFYGPVSFFEHGAKSFSRGAGSCIDHAHLHILPLKIDILPLLLSDYNFVKRDIDYVNKLKGKKEYLYYENSNNEIFIADFDSFSPRIPTQYLRRILAKMHNFELFWNWRDHLKFPQILNTTDKVSKSRENFKKINEKLILLV